MNNNSSTKLHLVRKSSIIGAAAKIEIFVDNIMVGKLKNGEEKIFNIEEGQHQIYARQGVWGGMKTKPITITLQNGGTIKLSCGFSNPFSVFLIELSTVDEKEISSISPANQIASNSNTQGKHNNKLAVQVITFFTVTAFLLFSGDASITWGDIINSIVWGGISASLIGLFIKQP